MANRGRGTRQSRRGRRCDAAHHMIPTVLVSATVKQAILPGVDQAVGLLVGDDVTYPQGASTRTNCNAKTPAILGLPGVTGYVRHIRFGLIAAFS